MCVSFFPAYPANAPRLAAPTQLPLPPTHSSGVSAGRTFGAHLSSLHSSWARRRLSSATALESVPSRDETGGAGSTRSGRSNVEGRDSWDVLKSRNLGCDAEKVRKYLVCTLEWCELAAFGTYNLELLVGGSSPLQPGAIGLPAFPPSICPVPSPGAAARPTATASRRVGPTEPAQV